MAAAVVTSIPVEERPKAVAATSIAEVSVALTTEPPHDVTQTTAAIAPQADKSLETEAPHHGRGEARSTSVASESPMDDGQEAPSSNNSLRDESLTSTAQATVTPPPVASVPEANDSLSDDDILAQFGAPPDEASMDEGGYEPVRSATTPTRPAARPATPALTAVPKTAPVAAEPVNTEPPVAAISMDDMPPAFEFWQRVLAEITDMLKSHAKAVSRASYPGAGRLEIAVPNKFAFSRRYVEKPESLKRLEDIASRLGNRFIKISVTSCNDDPEATSIGKTPDGKKPVKQRVYRPEEDPFVSNVMNVFGAQVVKVDPVLGSSISQQDV